MNEKDSVRTVRTVPRAGDPAEVEALADERCRQRLKDDLGLDDEAIDVIMRLRSQVTALQVRLQQVEWTLEVFQSGHHARLVRYREEVYEADWEEG